MNNMEQYEEANLASYWNFRFKESMIAKAPYTKNWQTYLDAYNGDYFKNEDLPDYKSDLVSNYVFAIIETIRPIMLDNDPKFQAMPRHPDAMKFSHDLQEAFGYEWDREKMNVKLYRELVTTLVLGTSIYFLPWDSNEKEVKAIPVNPFNIFPDPLATSVEDAEYIIYASYKHVERLKRAFPHHAENLSGGDINYGELVYENNKDANLDSQVLVLEVWTRDYEAFEEADTKTRKQKYPNGRVITLCPELGIVLSDKPNPYKDGEFPFKALRDYDIPGKFWGEGEVAQLLSPQKYMNELNNSILDNAKATANMPWVVDKNSGIGYGKLTNRPGLIIRKNPGTEVRRDQPPSIPSYVVNAVESYKDDMQQISGIHNSLRGEGETGVYTAQGILALQEAGQSRIRLKVKIMEEFLGELATMWYNRMKQFWREDRWVRIVKPDGTYDFREFTKDIFAFDFDIRIMAGSTMPVNRGAMLDLMIRLAQTVMPDGQAIVDREAVVEYLPVEIKASILQRMEEEEKAIDQQFQELQEALEELSAQLQQVAEESNSNDEEQFDIIEQIMKTMEEVNKQILQLQEEHGRLEDEKKAESERIKLREESYNAGYRDAERTFQNDSMMDAEAPLEMGMFGEDMESLPDGMPLDELGDEQQSLPDDLLNGIEQLTDDELALLLKQNPSLADLLR